MSGNSEPNSTVTDRDKAIVWSGKGNYEQATRACRDNGKQRLEGTQAGRALVVRNDRGENRTGIALEHEERLERDYAVKFQKQGLSAEQIEVRTKKAAVRIAEREWNDASRHFAANAQGNVDTYVIGAERQRTFRCYELPALLKNENVTSINGIDRKRLAQLNKTDAFDRVCQAELERDRKQEAVIGLDLEGREKTYINWRDQHYEQEKVIEAQMEARGRRLAVDDGGRGLKADPFQTRLKPRGPDAKSVGQERSRSHGPRRRE